MRVKKHLNTLPMHHPIAAAPATVTTAAAIAVVSSEKEKSNPGAVAFHIVV